MYAYSRIHTVHNCFKFYLIQIRDLNIAKRVEDIGFYAGFVGKLIKCIIF